MADETKVDVWMPLYVSDFLTATLGWSAEERGHYLTLLMAQWAMGGLPSDMKALERITPGVTECWGTVGEKFSLGTDGKLRNRRLEEHRSAAVENREKKVAAAHAANEAKRLKREAAEAGARLLATQTEVQADTECTTQTDTQTVSHSDTPSPSPSPISSKKKETDARAAAPPPKSRDPEDDFRRPGWVHDEWATIAPVWNAIDRAVPWTHLTPPNNFSEIAASPGRLDELRRGLAMLPGCIRFTDPVPWTQFVRDLDRILAGEFRTLKPPQPDRSRGRKPVAVGGGL
jgi:uncharacterized protein YdaU (DUF1376 family)